MKHKVLSWLLAFMVILCGCAQYDLPTAQEGSIQTPEQVAAVLAGLDAAASQLGEAMAQTQEASGGVSSTTTVLPEMSQSSRESATSSQTNASGVDASSTGASENLRPDHALFSKDPGYETISPFALTYSAIKEGKEQYGNPPATRPDTNICTVSISCLTAIDKGVNKEPGFTHLPADGWVLKPTEVSFEEGDCVFQVLTRTVRERGIHMQYHGFHPLQYIQGIDNIYEFDGGRWSGWMYCVNDWYPNFGCGQYEVLPGDVIEWKYTCNLGVDLGQTWLGDGIDIDAEK